jgi:hypothetical protein
MDAHTRGQHHARVRVLPHIKKLDDCFGQFLVRGGECAPRWRPTLLASQQTATL